MVSVLDRGKRTTFVNNANLGVIKSKSLGLGESIEAFGETSLKIAEQQAAIMDEIWKGDFKVKSTQFLNDLMIKQESLPLPDLSKAQAEIIAYRDELINKSSKRYGNYIKNYLDLNSLEKLDQLRIRSNSIMFNNAKNGIDVQLENLVNTTFNDINKIDENIDITNSDEYRLKVEDIFYKAKYSLNDIDFESVKNLNPLKYTDAMIKGSVDGKLLELETNRMFGIAKSFYHNIDFTDTEAVANADAKFNQYKKDYLSGNENRLSNNFDQDTIQKMVKALDSNVNTIKSLNQASIDAGNQQAEYANIILKEKIIDGINQNNAESMMFILNNDEATLYSQLDIVGETNNSDLIKTFLDKKEVYNYLENLSKKENINVNNAHKYFSHVKYNMGVEAFENEEDLKEFVKSYQLNKINLNSIFKTGESYTQADWFNDLGKSPGNQKQGTILMNNMIRKDGVVFDELQSELNSIYNVLGKGEYDINDVNKITNLYQGWEFITNENPIAIANMDDVDNSFFLFVQDQGGLKALELQGPAALYQSYLKKVDFTKSNKDKIVLVQNEILNDPLIQQGIDGQFTAELTDAVFKNEALNTIFMPLWNSIMKNPEYEFSTDNPLSSYIELAPGLVTGKGGKMSDMNFLQMFFIKGSESVWRTFDFLNPLSNDFYTKNFSTGFYRIKPAVREELNNAILNQLPNYMDVSLFAENPEEAKAIFVQKAPQIMKSVIENMAENNYSISLLGGDLGQAELVKFGYETEMAKAGYSEDEMMTRTAFDIGAVMKDYSERYGENYMLENFGFLYSENGQFKEPGIQDIKKSIKNGDFSIKTIKGANQPIYEIFINHPNTTLQGMPLGVTGNEKIIIEPLSEGTQPYATPITKSQINNTIVQNIINDPNSLFNKFDSFQQLPDKMKELIVKSFTIGRPGTEVILEPLVEIFSGGTYDYKSIQDELNKYIEVEYKKMYEDYVD